MAKKTAAVGRHVIGLESTIFLVRRFYLTARCTPNYDTSYTPIYPAECSCFCETLGRLQSRFDGVYWIEEKIDGCACDASCLEDPEFWSGFSFKQQSFYQKRLVE